VSTQRASSSYALLTGVEIALSRRFYAVLYWAPAAVVLSIRPGLFDVFDAGPGVRCGAAYPRSSLQRYRCRTIDNVSFALLLTGQSLPGISDSQNHRIAHPAKATSTSAAARDNRCSGVEPRRGRLGGFGGDGMINKTLTNFRTRKKQSNYGTSELTTKPETSGKSQFGSNRKLSRKD